MKVTKFQLFLWGSIATIATFLASCSSEPTPSTDTQTSSSIEENVSSSNTQASPSSEASKKDSAANAQTDSNSPKSEQVSSQLKTSKPYINRLLPQATRIQKEHGIPVDVTLAIAMLETGWGKHVIGKNNHFGLRCASESCVARVKRGRTIQYETCPNPSECFNLFAETVQKLTNGETANIDKLAQEYASDPKWAKRVKKIQKRVRKILDKAREEAKSAYSSPV